MFCPIGDFHLFIYVIWLCDMILVAKMYYCNIICVIVSILNREISFERRNVIFEHTQILVEYFLSLNNSIDCF